MQDIKKVTLTEKEYIKLKEYIRNKDYKNVLDFFNNHYTEIFTIITTFNCKYNNNLRILIELIAQYELNLQAEKYYNNIINENFYKNECINRINERLQQIDEYIEEYKNLI